MLAPAMQPSDLVIANGRCLVPGQGLVDADLKCADGYIAEIGKPVFAGRAKVLDADGAIVLPGIVDIHGDAFERQIMPRPKTVFPHDIALIDTDRQLVANGITTAYHGVTVSWEPGLRSLASAARIIATLDMLEDRLAADHLLHIRWETFALNEIDCVTALFERSKRPLLAFNDHTTPSVEGNRPATKLRGSVERAMIELDEYMGLLKHTWRRRDEVPEGIKKMAKTARAHGIVMLSHDDRSAEMRMVYRDLGVGIAEFPMTADALDAAAAASEPVILGAPNVMRGKSHNGAIDATTAVHTGQCSILASDYYYPSMLHAALKLAGEDFSELESSWALISRNPAQAAGLSDRGAIFPGARADLIVVDHLRVATTVVAGKVVFQGQ